MMTSENLQAPVGPSTGRARGRGHGTPRVKAVGSSRIALHDYCGHPFQFELSRELARRGHEVRHFFFAEDMGPKGNTGRLSSDPANFSIEPISIGRPYSKQNLVRRRQADILYGQLASQRIASFAPDVTISGNTPLEAQAPILTGVRQAGSAFVFWMQDFYSLAAAKILSRKIPIVGHAIGAYYRHLEASMLRRSDGIVLASEDFRPALKDFGVRDDAADVIPNWGALDTLPLRPKDNSWAMQHGLSGKFVFLYAGTLALKHNPDLLWALAEHFEADPDVVIAVAASGVSYDALKARSVLESKPNLVFLPLQPMDVFPDVLGAADVLVSSAGMADRSWVGAQHLVTQLVTPMIDNGRGDVVLLSPELIGASPEGAHRMLDAWVSGLDAEFVGTGVRASVVRSTGQVPPDDVARLIAAAICAPDRMRLRLVDVIPSRRESATIDGLS